MYIFNRGSSTWAPSDAPLYSVLFTYVSQHRSLTAIDQKKSFLSFIGFHYRDTRNKDREKSSGQTQFVNNKSHGKNLRSTPSKTEPILRSVSLKIRPLVAGTATFCPGNTTTCTLGMITTAGNTMWGRGCGVANLIQTGTLYSRVHWLPCFLRKC